MLLISTSIISALIQVSSSFSIISLIFIGDLVMSLPHFIPVFLTSSFSCFGVSFMDSAIFFELNYHTRLNFAYNHRYPLTQQFQI